MCVLIGRQFYKYLECITRLITFILESTATWHRPQFSVASLSPPKKSQRKVVISSISSRRRNEVCLVVKYKFCSFAFVYLYMRVCKVRAFIHIPILSNNSNLKTGINKAARATNRSFRNIVLTHNDMEDA
jgi:hypothetical protein